MKEPTASSNVPGSVVSSVPIPSENEPTASSNVPGSIVSSVPIMSEDEPTASSNIPVPGPSGDENKTKKGTEFSINLLTDLKF